MSKPACIEGLTELALNLRWSWNRSADDIWGRLEPELWELTHNPWAVLQTVSQQKLEALGANPSFCGRIDELLRAKQEAQSVARWFQTAHPDSPLKLAAYFSMEYMLSEALPIYSGGLGNVAGDQLKAASDVGVPIVAVGLLYQQGYFRQTFDANGNQLALYPFNDPGQLPIQPLRNAQGEWLRLPLSLPGLKLWVRAWQVEVGRHKLYLLDSNDPANPATHRSITSELYGGGPDLRICQELILGIGGWRLLRALGLQPQVLHLNEGHAAFAALERARSYMEDHQQPFDQAMAVTRAGNVFTTHTAVDAGFDRFPAPLVEKYLKRYAEHGLGVGFDRLLSMGRRDGGNGGDPFNMGFLAMRLSGSVNGVSRLHGEVSRRLFQILYPRWPTPEVPVGYITNGVHVPTWESGNAAAMWTEISGPNRWLSARDTMEGDLRKVSDQQLWQLRTGTTRHLIDYTRKRLARQRAEAGAPTAEVAAAERIFNADLLTLGFARRFATYKRPDLLLHDPDRLLRILNHPQHPVQLILAGKAHPQDGEGQAIVRRWNDFIRRPEAHSRVVFLSDYDMRLTQQLVRGVDLWINTPRRPWEASGTSGMKVLVNGGLNLSELDGWWAEAYTPAAGWAIGDGNEHGDDPAWDAAEADALYSLLERDIVPAFYNRDGNGVPQAWVSKMRESLAQLTPRFSANRTVREYTDAEYLPAAERYCERAAENGKLGAELVAWQGALAAHWGRLRFGAPQVKTHDGVYLFEVPVFLGELTPGQVTVELYADPGVRISMSPVGEVPGSGRLYAGEAPSNRPAGDYTLRIVPFMPGVSVPLEAAHILWQK